MIFAPKTSCNLTICKEPFAILEATNIPIDGHRCPIGKPLWRQRSGRDSIRKNWLHFKDLTNLKICIIIRPFLCLCFFLIFPNKTIFPVMSRLGVIIPFIHPNSASINFILNHQVSVKYQWPGLGNIQTTMERSTMLFMGKSTILTGPFSSSQTVSHNMS